MIVVVARDDFVLELVLAAAGEPGAGVGGDDRVVGVLISYLGEEELDSGDFCFVPGEVRFVAAGYVEGGWGCEV